MRRFPIAKSTQFSFGLSVIFVDVRRFDAVCFLLKWLVFAPWDGRYKFRRGLAIHYVKRSFFLIPKAVIYKVFVIALMLSERSVFFQNQTQYIVGRIRRILCKRCYFWNIFLKNSSFFHKKPKIRSTLSCFLNVWRRFLIKNAWMFRNENYIINLWEPINRRVCIYWASAEWGWRRWRGFSLIKGMRSSGGMISQRRNEKNNYPLYVGRKRSPSVAMCVFIRPPLMKTMCCGERHKAFVRVCRAVHSSRNS